MRRPLVELHSRLGDIPIEWLRLNEPRLVRGAFLPCWIWSGRCDNNGYPLLKSPVTGKYVMTRRFVAAMFWKFPDHYYVALSCNNINCLNPRHIVPQEEHPKWAPPTVGI